MTERSSDADMSREDAEREPALDDLDVPEREAGSVSGGAVPKTPPTPPGVPIPYPNVTTPKA
jgi:hypothetical protein